MNKKTNNTFLIDIAVPNIHNLAKTITDKQNKYQELANEICAMWKQNAVKVIPILISSMGLIPKSLSQSLTRLNLHPNTYIQLQKSVNSWHMFNCKKLFKLQIRPPNLTLLITTSRDRWIFPSQSWEARNSMMMMMMIIIIIIPPAAWMFVRCECCVLSGRGLGDELITRPGESYRLWHVVVCDLETLWIRRPWPTGGCRGKQQANLHG